MRVWFLGAFAAVFLSGCSHFSRLGPADFDHGEVPAVQFSRDNYDCETKAVIEENMAGGGDVTGTFNRAYVACMKTRGYATNDIDFLGFSG